MFKVNINKKIIIIILQARSSIGTIYFYYVGMYTFIYTSRHVKLFSCLIFFSQNRRAVIAHHIGESTALTFRSPKCD